MTEEEKELFIKREKKRLTGNFPEMPKGMVDAIIEWNLGHKDLITDTIIDWVTEVAHCHRREYSDLLSSNANLACGTLVIIIGRDLTNEVCKSDELERLFERYVFNIQSLAFGDGKTADQIKP